MTNKYINFTNGFYDLHKFEFVENKQKSNQTVGYDYCDKYSDKYAELLNFLEEIQPNKEHLENMLSYFSKALYDSPKIFILFIGNGPCGKSCLVNLLNHTFGDYFGNSLGKNKKILYLENAKDKIKKNNPNCLTITTQSNQQEIQNDNKIVSFLFTTKFTPNPKNTGEKKMDPNIYDNFNLWKMDFMLLLIEYYKKNCDCIYI